MKDNISNKKMVTRFLSSINYLDWSILLKKLRELVISYVINHYT
jgi:hypothetical protein